MTYEEDEAYNEGRSDVDHYRNQYWRDEHADYDTPDRAYFQGRKDRLAERERERSEREYWDNEYWSMRGE